MPSRNVYLSQALADKVKDLNINVSKVVQEALHKIVEERTGCCSCCGEPLKEVIAVDNDRC